MPSEHPLSVEAAPASAASPRLEAAQLTVSAPSANFTEVSDWDLSELLPDPGEETLRHRIAEIDVMVEAFEAQRPRLSSATTPADLLDLLARYEALLDRMDRLGGYASLWFSSDTQSTEAVSFRNRIHQVLTRLHNRFLFFTLWWKSLDDADAERLVPTAPEHEDYRRFLAELRRFRPHTLDETVEQVINTKDANGMDAIITLYSMLTNRMEFTMEVEGETRVLTEEEMRSQFFAPDADLRERTYQALFGRYGAESTVLAQIYASRVRDWHNENVDLRGFSSPIAVRNLNNDIADQAVATMLDVVRQNAPLFQDYFRLKGEWLGITPVRRYDVYAPLATSSATIPWADAVSSVLDTLRSFDARFADLAERVFRDNHIDSAIRKGKRSGAFCATILPELTPWVMVNYTGRVRDVATLAHELGHAVHSMLAGEHSLLTQHPPLPLAETASVFSEMLMTDRMLARTHDPMARRELLAAAVDDIYATVMRQTFFVRFELDAHAHIMADRPMDELYDMYLANLREQFGPDMRIGDELRYEWLSIPHIFNTPFYCYAYSFGQLLVLALYRRYQHEGDAFKPGYLKLLSYGGSKSPAEALAEMDIDIEDAAFWQGGFEVVKDMIDELKSIELPS